MDGSGPHRIATHQGLTIKFSWNLSFKIAIFQPLIDHPGAENYFMWFDSFHIPIDPPRYHSIPNGGHTFLPAHRSKFRFVAYNLNGFKMSKDSEMLIQHTFIYNAIFWTMRIPDQTTIPSTYSSKRSKTSHMVIVERLRTEL